MFIAFLLASSALPRATAIDPGSWFSPSNYPIEAIKKGIEGSVTFDADIDPSGKATVCRVVVSSGYQILDQATCTIVLSQGRFIPATGPEGKPVAGHYSNRTIWRLPTPPRIQAPVPAAEPVTGSRLPVAAEDLPFTRSTPDQLFGASVNQSDRDSYAVAQKLGACLVKADPTTSMAFVMATPGSDASKAAREKLKAHMVDCLGASVDPFAVGEIKMTIRPTMARGVIAEALYRLQFADRQQPDRHVSVAPVLAAATADAADRDDAIVYEFAQCVTDANPSAVRSLILSKLGSRDEQAAIGALSPTLSPCLYKGQTLKTDRLTFRSRLAEALYRWSVSAAQPASGVQSH